MATQELIDGRLDAIDRALLGILPRSERLKIVADVEARVRDGADAGSVLAEELAAPQESARPADSVAPRGRRVRSRLALTSGVVGIVALVLLFFMPISYLVVSMLSEVVGEFMTMGLLAANVLVVAVGGAAAVTLGIAALVRLARRRSAQVGHGWAITGLCTGPLPMLVGGLALLTVILPMSGMLVSECRDYTEPAYASMPVQESPRVMPVSNVPAPVNQLQPLPPANNGGWQPTSAYPQPVSNSFAPTEQPPSIPSTTPPLPPSPASLSLPPSEKLPAADLRDAPAPVAPTSPSSDAAPATPPVVDSDERTSSL